MRKTACLFFLILFLAQALYGESQPIKLRVGYHRDFLRIVLEGERTLIKKAIVNQKARGVLVTFPDGEISIEHEGDIRIPYRKLGQGAILFSPGNFRGLKVFTLSRPDRLVIDVYLENVSKRTVEEPLRLRMVIIDPGHGGYEYGITSGQYREKNVVLDIAKRLGALIGRGSTKAEFTRRSDLYMSLSERVKFANSKGADLFISLHVGNHEGVVIYLPVVTDSTPDYIRAYLINRGQMDYLDRTSALARAIREAIASDLGEEMVTIEPLPYSILSRIEAAAVLVELPSFEDINYTDDFKSRIAKTIYRGLYIYEEGL